MIAQSGCATVLKMAAKRDGLEDDPEGRPSPKVPKPLAEKHNSTKRLIVVLERSSLETVKVSDLMLYSDY